MEGELLREKRGRVLLLTISNPAARNALGPAIYRAGYEALMQAADDHSVGVVVMAGAGEHFSSGGNLNRIRANREKPCSVSHDGITQLHDWILAIRTCPKPVVAAVEGVAAGAGFSLALACDLMVAAEDARFVAAHVKVGISPDGGISGALARSLPPQMLAEMLLEGKTVTADRLSWFGIVNHLCGKGEALPTALEWGKRLAAGPPQAMGRIKLLVEYAYRNDLSAQLDLERRLAVEGIFHDECREGIAAFFEKRSPVFMPGGTE
jgi:enoyl-CoA hydratase/carnithine racemase